MRWWEGAFASSSKSNSVDDTDVRYSARPGFLSSRWNRRLQRARKLRYINGNKDNSSSKSSSVTPQPLPLPELQELLQRDPKFSKNKAPLHSPRDAVQISRDRGGNEEIDKDTIVERLNDDVVDGVDVLKRLGPDPRANAEHPETRPSRKSQHKRSEKRRSPENITIPTSDPSSPYSSLSPSPRTSDFTQYMIPPAVFQIWSAPEMPHSDRNPGVFQVWSAPELPHSDRNLSPGFYFQFPSEKSAPSMDNSPLQSPKLSSNTPDTSPRRSVSPMNTRLSSDMPMVRRESNAQAAVPLPLPPGAGMFSQPTPLFAVSDFSGASTPSQSTPIFLQEAKPEFPVANISSQSAPISPGGNRPELVPFKSQWQKGKLIGRGTFGSVYVASNRMTGALCAVKEVEILPDDSKSAESIRQLEQEIKVLSRLKHPNIVQYFGSEIVGDKFYIYLEYVHPGSINKFIHDHCRAITESVVRNFTRHILCGLAFLHSKKTIHRDIKGANLLVDAYGVVKLADFGMAKHLNGQAANLSLKGSPYWLAPELLQSSRQKDTSSDIALAVDIWSLGCTIIEMINGKPPWSEYEGAAALFKVLQETPPIPEKLSAEGKDFLQCCFRRKPADRPTAIQLLDHPFLNNSLYHDACTQSLKEIRLSETIQFLKDRSNRKKGNMDNNFYFRPDSISPVEEANGKISKHLI